MPVPGPGESMATLSPCPGQTTAIVSHSPGFRRVDSRSPFGLAGEGKQKGDHVIATDSLVLELPGLKPLGFDNDHEVVYAKIVRLPAAIQAPDDVDHAVARRIVRRAATRTPKLRRRPVPRRLGTWKRCQAAAPAGSLTPVPK